MSGTRRSILFILIAFGVSWTVAVIAWRGGMAGLGDTDRFPLFQLFPFGPAIAALLCTMALEPRRDWRKALGLGFRPNRWWLFALLFPLAIRLVSAVTSIIIAGHDLAMAQSWKQAFAQLTDNVMARNFPNIWVAIAAASLIALITEEPGWRGYLYHMWRGAGFWRYSVAIGLLWSLWHLPMIAWFDLDGGTMGDNLLSSMLYYTSGVTMLAVYCTLIRDRAGSMIPVAIFHGAWNSVGNHGEAWIAVNVAMLLGIAVIACRQWTGKRREAITATPAAAVRSD